MHNILAVPPNWPRQAELLQELRSVPLDCKRRTIVRYLTTPPKFSLEPLTDELADTAVILNAKIARCGTCKTVWRVWALGELRPEDVGDCPSCNACFDRMILRTGRTAEFLRATQPAHPKDIKDFTRTRPATALDGFRVSIQASPFHYCTPRVGPWRHVELEAPACAEALLAPYIDAYHMSEIYGCVPVDVVDTVLAFHDAAGLVARQHNTEALILVDALRSTGVVTAPEANPNNWTQRERFELAHGLALRGVLPMGDAG